MQAVLTFLLTWLHLSGIMSRVLLPFMHDLLTLLLLLLLTLLLLCSFCAAGTVSKVVHSFMDADAWTGHSQEAVTLMPLALSMPAGSKATLTVPELCRPAAAAAGGSGSSGSVALSLKNKQQQQVVGSSSIAFPFLG
jgi:hypothetical protein